MKSVVTLRRETEDKDSPRTFTVSKPLWEYWSATHGSDVALVDNGYFRDQTPIQHNQAQRPSDEDCLSQASSLRTSYQARDTQSIRSLSNLGDGIVGLHNNAFFCYMNACLQCLIAIEPLRDHFLAQEHLKFKSQKTRRQSLEFCLEFE